MSGRERTYLYALVRPGDVRIDLTGLRSAPVRVVAVGDIGAVVSTVPAELFDPDTAGAELSDTAVVSDLARAHDDVVTAMTGVATTIPLRLGTTADDDESVRALLTDLAKAAHRTFDRFEGRTEYGVQIFAARDPERSGAPAEGGAAFLRRRRAELEQDNARHAAAVADAEAAYKLLADLAVDDRRLRVRDGRSGTTRAMVLNGAFLVDRAAVADFRAATDALAARLGPDRVVITGPWAPYSFAELEL